MKTSGVSRVSDIDWLSTDHDPQFLFSFRFFRPRYLLIYLEAVAGELDPVLYFDRGRGFSEEDSIPLPHGGMTIYVISLTSLPNVTAVRVDPATRALKFKFWTRRVYREGSLDAIAARVAKAAVEANIKPPIWYRIGEQHAASPPSIRVAAAPNIRDHFDFVWRLAQTQFADTVLPADLRESTPTKTLISLVVPVFNTPQAYLTDLANSFRHQGADDAELIFVDDGSTSATTLEALAQLSTESGIRCLTNARNAGIVAASNAGIAASRGQWVGFIDHDDALAPLALVRLKQALSQFPEGKFFYTDEVVTDDELEPKGYILKPVFDPVLLSGVNYINHFSLYRRDILTNIGGFRSGFDGSQDYDLLLRYTRLLSEEEIVHVPYPAYLWRRSSSTFSATHQIQCMENARRALAEHYQSTTTVVPIGPALDTTLHRPRFDMITRHWPPVTVIIPNRNAFDLISSILEGLNSKTDYPDLDIVVVDNGSDDQKVHELYAAFGRSNPRFRAIVSPQPFNFSRQVNIGIEQARPGHILLLNNDTEILSNDWLKEMVSCLAYADVGIVGARLLYPNRTIQHAGVIVGLGGLAGHWFEKKPHSHPGPFGRLRVRQSLSAVTAACMLISRECIEMVGRFDESSFAIAYNDVDFCLRAAAAGFRTVWTPFALLIHHESVSRGSDDSDHNRERFSREKGALQRRHRTEEFIDPHYNPWYTRHRSEPGLALLTSLPAARTGRPPKRHEQDDD